MTQLGISHFLSRNKPGVIVHISSVAGQKPFFPTLVYVAIKHAISGFVRSVAELEYPPKKTGLPSITMPEEVTRVMLEQVGREENHGGTVLKVG
jgi:3-hydroxybutyrate dehydrogenase